MMNLKRLLFVSTLLLSTGAYAGAGSGAGNGGHGVVCRAPDKSIISIEPLDLFEARVIHRWNLSLGTSDLGYQQKAVIALKRLAKFSPKRAALYTQWLQDFEKETLFLNGVDLSFIPDSDSLAVSQGCQLEQVVIQKAPALPGDPRYTINGDLWNRLNSDQKAAMALHEITYREMLTFGHLYSTAARYLVGMMTSNFMDTLTMAQFLETLQDLAIPTIDLAGIDVKIIQCKDDVCQSSQDVVSKETFSFYPSGNLRAYTPRSTYCSVDPYQPYEFPIAANVKQVIEPCDKNSGWTFKDQLPPVVSSVFSDTVNLKGSFGTVHGKPSDITYQLSQAGNILKLKGGQGTTSEGFNFTANETLYFTEDGKLLEADPIQGSVGSLTISADRFQFYPGLLPKRAEGKISITGLTKNGQTLPEVVSVGPGAPVYADSRIEWDSQGNWTESELGHRFQGNQLSRFNCSTKTNSVETDIGGITQQGEKGTISLIPAVDTEICDDFGNRYAIVKAGKRLDLETQYFCPLSLVLSSDTWLNVEVVHGNTGNYEAVPFKASERIEYFDVASSHEFVIKSGVLSTSTSLKTSWFSKTVSGGTRVQFDKNGYLVDP